MIGTTYLGGSAAYIEQLRRLDASFQRVDVADVVDRPYALASLPAQRFDAPPEQGIHLDATLHTRSLNACRNHSLAMVQTRTWIMMTGR